MIYFVITSFQSYQSMARDQVVDLDKLKIETQMITVIVNKWYIANSRNDI